MVVLEIFMLVLTVGFILWLTGTIVVAAVRRLTSSATRVQSRTPAAPA